MVSYSLFFQDSISVADSYGIYHDWVFGVTDIAYGYRNSPYNDFGVRIFVDAIRHGRPVVRRRPTGLFEFGVDDDLSAMVLLLVDCIAVMNTDQKEGIRKMFLELFPEIKFHDVRKRWMDANACLCIMRGLASQSNDLSLGIACQSATFDGERTRIKVINFATTMIELFYNELVSVKMNISLGRPTVRSNLVCAKGTVLFRSVDIHHPINQTLHPMSTMAVDTTSDLGMHALGCYLAHGAPVNVTVGRYVNCPSVVYTNFNSADPYTIQTQVTYVVAHKRLMKGAGLWWLSYKNSHVRSRVLDATGNYSDDFRHYSVRNDFDGEDALVRASMTYDQHGPGSTTEVSSDAANDSQDVIATSTVQSDASNDSQLQDALSNANIACTSTEQMIMLSENTLEQLNNERVELLENISSSTDRPMTMIRELNDIVKRIVEEEDLMKDLLAARKINISK